MKFDASTIGNDPVNVYDLDTGAMINDVVSADTVTGQIVRHDLNENGDAVLQGMGWRYITEKRRFRVVRAEDGVEISRTGADPYEALMSMFKRPPSA